jgi:dihydroorotate dehydrogenase
MMALFPLVRPVLFAATDAETAHRLTIRALGTLPHRPLPAPEPMLRMSLAGIEFPNPVGLAAGFDKNAEVPDAMLGFGFGFVEVGTLTPRPQAGNPKPRIFRLAEDRAVINRLGFNNAGQDAALARLRRRRRRGIVGVNIGANKDAADRIADYVAGTRAMAGVADYLTVNISSPNTPGLRALQDRAALADLLAGVMAARGDFGPPVFLKVAPDLLPADIDDIAEVSAAARIDALIVSNTTIGRPALGSRHAGETGGLSGAPLKPLALERLRDFRRATGGMIPLMAAGGIASAEDAYARFRAGASLVQLYTALVYKGPGLAKRIVAGLPDLLRRDGFADLASAVGSDAA